MALATAWSVALLGVTGHVIEVEADLAQGLPGTQIVGLPDASLSEARDRVRAAVVNSGESWPSSKITLGLSPATLPKHGSGFDLAVAAAILTAAGAAPADQLAKRVLLGELGLDGRVRPVRGVLPAVVAAARAGFVDAVVPCANAPEARLVPGTTVHGVCSLRAFLSLLRGDQDDVPTSCPSCREPADACPDTGERLPDLCDVVGQELGRAALEIAAAGGHHLSMLGPPGAGKTMLAERLPGVLPPLSTEEALEVTAVHSVAGALPPGAPLVRRPPFQAPHHSASMAALVGGGAGIARPGALSLAHRGVLFLDEAPEFPTGVLDALRQPLERGTVVLARSGGITCYPARVQLVVAANPCPCASPRVDGCSCSPAARRRYLARLSGPLLDRIDVQIQLAPVRAAAVYAEPDRLEHSESVRRRVVAARAAAAERWAAHRWRLNAEAPGPALRQQWRLPRSVTASADHEIESGGLTARGYDRVLRIAWTLADLGGRTAPTVEDVRTAVELRTGRLL